ncbi:MAG: SDR family oxidoreductase [Candidatus Binatia bacterium]
MDLKNQVIMITGASSGIGKQLAIDLATRGAIVAGCGRSIERLRDTLKEVRRTSPSSAMIGCDVSDAEQVQGMVAKIVADFGKIDVLINNAGIGMRKPFIETDLKTIEEIIRINYLGAAYCTKAVQPHMIARRTGHVVNISSGAGLIGTLNMAAYCASKFAMNGWSESLYHELKPLGIDVSIVCPGPVQTEFNRDFRDSEPKAASNLIVSAEAVAQAVIKVVENKHFEVVLPRWLALVSSLRRHLPNVFRALAQRRFRRHVTLPEKISGRAD